MASKPTWKALMEMSPSDRAEDFLARAQELSSTLVRQDGVVQVSLLELYRALYAGVPGDNRRRKAFTDSIARKGAIKSNGDLGPKGATWTVNFPEAEPPAGHGTSPGDDILPEDDRDKMVPVDEEVEEPRFSKLQTDRRKAEIELSLQARRVEVFRFAENVLELAQAVSLDRREFDEAVNMARESL